ncbi:MAG: ImmA/IrrE family metallo-endopeptidase [Gammaproteobacteria bacterium AqS3]|nr:ImmA/IrrE family metallo-endopeptidase [Gammaproteobacteria bacterium AqS3]
MASVQMTSLDPEHREILERHLSDTPIRLGEIARELGIAVTMSGLPMGISGQIKKEGNQYVIRVNRDESFERQRFTIAHELAHYFLHRDFIEHSPDGIQEGVLYRARVPGQNKRETIRLAFSILLPAELIRREFSKLKSQVPEGELSEQMAANFQVSHSLMKAYLKKLKFLRA